MSVVAFAKNELKIKVVAAHQVTHDDQSAHARVEKGMMGAGSVTHQVESFNLDAVVNGEHVFLACEDPKGCESIAPGDYDGEKKRGNFVRVSFTLPLTEKKLTRWYSIAGTW